MVYKVVICRKFHNLANAGSRVNIVSDARVIIKQGDPGEEDTGQMFNLIGNSLMAKGL